jgi:hypothetical protein
MRFEGEALHCYPPPPSLIRLCRKDSMLLYNTRIVFSFVDVYAETKIVEKKLHLKICRVKQLTFFTFVENPFCIFVRSFFAN